MGRVFVFLITVCLFVHGGAAAQHAHFSLSDAEIERLAADQRWLKLGRYKEGLLPGRTGPSDIVSREHFLAENGWRSPEAELRATLAALSEPADDQDEGVLCAYPARALFLKREAGLDLPEPVEACPAYRAFVNDGAVNGVSVLFIGSYLSNPGSAFGHLLLRFHGGDEDLPVQSVLDRAINYGAAASEEDPMIPYIIKGLTGRYRSTFSTLEFFHHAERYRESQLRNIWEYRLDLNQSEVDLLTAHVWELLETENRYYFMRQNCAYRIAEIVELVLERDLIPRTKGWVAPIDVFHELAEERQGGGSDVRSITRLASRETIFLDGYAGLDRRQRRLVDSVIEEPWIPIEDQIAASNTNDPAPALNVLLDRYAYEAETEEERARRRETVLARMTLPPNEQGDIVPPPPPHSGQRPSLAQVSLLDNDELGTGYEIRLRPAYFDLLSSAEGTVPYGELSMADTRVVVRDGKVDLRQLEVVRVTALHPKTRNTPGEGKLAWRVHLGAEDRSLACDQCLLGYAEAGAGKAYEIAPGAVAYALASGRLEAGRHSESTVHVRATSGLVLRSKFIALQAEGGFLQGLDDGDETRPFGRAELRLGTGRRWDIRTGAAFDEALEYRLSASFYW